MMCAAPTHVRVNMATVEYQIFEWRAPVFGTVRKYRVYVRAFVGPHMLNTDNPLYYAEVRSCTIMCVYQFDAD